MSSSIFLKFKPFFAPKSQIFIDPDTRHQYKARTRAELLNLIISYRKQNELAPLEYLSTVVENYQCALPENLGSCEPIKKLQRGAFPTLLGGIAVLKNLFFGAENMVGQTEADERSRICAGCPENQFPDKGAFVEWSDAVAFNSTGGKKASAHEELGNCAVCTCPLRAKVWAKGPHSLTKDQASRLPSFCWQKADAKVA